MYAASTTTVFASDFLFWYASSTNAEANAYLLLIFLKLPTYFY